MSVQLELFSRLLKAASITAVEYIASFASQILDHFYNEFIHYIS